MFDDFLYRLLDGLISIIEYFISFLPEINPEVYFIPANASDYINWVGNIINVDALFFVAMTIVLYELAMVSVRVFLFIWRLLPIT